MAYDADTLAESGLIGYWPLDEAAGATVAQDATANNRDGTVSGATSGQAGIPAGGGSYLFDGVNDVVSIASHTDFDFASGAAFSVEFWTFVATPYPGTSQYWVTKIGTNVGRDGWGFRYHATDGEVESVRIAGGTSEFDTANVPLTLDAWNHVLCAFDGTTQRSWVNGVAGDTDAIATSLVANPGDLRIGSGDNVNFFAGRIAKVAIYTVAKDGTFAAARYASGTSAGDPPQVARPSSTIAAGSWTAVGAATIHEAIDEATASDTDYAQSSESPASADAVRVAFAALTDPGVHTGHTVRYRLVKSATGGDALQATARLYQGTTLIATDPTVRTVPDAATTYAWTISEAEAATIASYAADELRLDVSVIKP